MSDTGQMDKLLPYFERELSYLQRHSPDFAARYPRIAGRLAPIDGHSDDPHVERITNALTMLGARIGCKLDDDYSELTASLFDVMYPHYLRPFPACSIAQFAVGPAEGDVSPFTIPRGTELASRPINGVACRFRTAYDVTLAPLAISAARYRSLATAPIGLPAKAAGIASITFESTSTHFDLHTLDLHTVRAHLGGEQSFVAALADGLFVHALTTMYVEADGNGHWQPLPVSPVTQAGFSEDDALLDHPTTSHPASRLFAEYSGFPMKFDFADFDLGVMLKTAGPCRRVTLHVVLRKVREDPRAVRLLESLSAAHFKLFSTPIVNLFHQHADPFRVTHRTTAYSIVADARHASAYEVYSIDSVHLIRQTGQHDEVTEFRAPFSQHYGGKQRSGHYWFARRNEAVALKNPGYETEISLVDIDFNPLAEQTDTLSVELTCTNRDLPSRLAVGLAGGDLFMPQGIDGRAPVTIAMLHRPTQTVRVAHGRALHWRLVSLLALDHVPLADRHVAALKEMLMLYDLRRSAVSSRHITGIAGIASRNAVMTIPGQPLATYIRGIEVRLTIDEKHFVGTSMATFAGVIDAVFACYVLLNSFVQLTVVSKHTGEEILRCRPRNDESILA